MALADLALSRSRLDKTSDDRFADGLLASLLQDATTSLLPVSDGRAPVELVDGSPRLRTVSGEAAVELVAGLGGAAALAAGGSDPAVEVVVVHLGRYPADDPRAPGALLGLLLPGAPEPPAADTADGAVTGQRLPAGLYEAPTGGLRELGALLGDTDAGALTEAVALQNWHSTHPRCPRCGGPTQVRAAGHERVCPADGSSHHPRHDPAVIMTVTDRADRLLLGRQGRWPAGRFSAFAGFVEPGESLEQAVARELLEESGVTVRQVTYLGSQPWPFPASLMLAFHAETDDTDAVPDGDEIAEARWFDREGLLAALAAGEVTVPPTVSVARRLIERWLGGPVESGGSWR